MLRERPDRVFFGSSDTLVFKTKQYLRKILFWWEGNFIVRFCNIVRFLVRTLANILKKCQGNLSLKIKKVTKVSYYAEEERKKRKWKKDKDFETYLADPDNFCLSRSGSESKVYSLDPEQRHGLDPDQRHSLDPDQRHGLDRDPTLRQMMLYIF